MNRKLIKKATLLTMALYTLFLLLLPLTAKAEPVQPSGTRSIIVVPTGTTVKVSVKGKKPRYRVFRDKSKVTVSQKGKTLKLTGKTPSKAEIIARRGKKFLRPSAGIVIWQKPDNNYFGKFNKTEISLKAGEQYKLDFITPFHNGELIENQLEWYYYSEGSQIKLEQTDMLHATITANSAGYGSVTMFYCGKAVAHCGVTVE